MIPARSKIGLKEWSVTVDALAKGDQTVLVRKGGIREDGRQFKVEHEDFFLYPTHYHEAPSLVKPQYRPLLDGHAADDFEDIVTLAVYAEVAEVFEVSDEAAVEALDPFHIWTGEYAAKRAHWKPRHPLHAIVVRAHLLQQPQALMVMEEYRGCKSWVNFVEEYPVGVTTPAVSERRFTARLNAIREALAAAGAAV